VYEGDVRFEHCYRVDEERQVPITDKLQCWREWTRRYRYGQSRDRMQYAFARERTLAQALAAGQQAAPRGAGDLARAVPQPTNPFATPPQTLAPASPDGGGAGERLASRDRAAGDAGMSASASFVAGPGASAMLVDAPGANCAASCAKTWNACKEPCKGAACRSACDDPYRSCMRACF
jgi:hypothetical protein